MNFIAKRVIGMKQILKKATSIFTSRLFRRMLLGYLALIVVFASLCCYAYHQTLTLSMQHLRNQNQLVFEQSASNLSSARRMIETFNENLYNRSDLQQLMRYSASDAQSAMIDVYKIIRNLPNINDSNGVIENYFVYLPKLDCIVAPEQGFTNPARYYDTFFSLSGSRDYASWREQILSAHNKPLQAVWQGNSEIHYVTTLASASNSVSDSCLVIYQFDCGRLLQQLSAAFAGNMECVLILDSEGNLLTSSANSTAFLEALKELSLDADSGSLEYLIGDTKYILSYQTVPEFGMQIMILIPHYAVAQQARASIHGMLTLLGWLLLIGLTVIVLMILANYLPLMKIEEHIVSVDGAKDLRTISDVFLHMESNRQELERRIEDQKMHMRSACVNRLIHGNISDALDLEEMLKRSEMTIRGGIFRGVLIALNNIQPNNVSHALILDLIEQQSKHLMFLAFESLNVIACLYSQEDDESADMRGVFTQLYEAAYVTCGFEIAFYIGHCCNQLKQIADSFASAEWVMNTSSRNEWLCIAQPDTHAASLSMLLSAEDEKKLENFVNIGDQEEVLALLDKIYQQNFIRNNIRGFRRQYLCCRLVGILASCDEGFSDADELPEQFMELSDHEFFAWLSERFTRCCEQTIGKNIQRSQCLIDSVRRYIEDNYADYELTLNSLAFHFGITGKYLSSLFKKQVGINVSAYLEQIRIDHAEQLLVEPSLTIDEIATSIGYANSDSFRRAFRRVRGISPSQFRTSAETKSPTDE